MGKKHVVDVLPHGIRKPRLERKENAREGALRENGRVRPTKRQSTGTVNKQGAAAVQRKDFPQRNEAKASSLPS